MTFIGKKGKKKKKVSEKIKHVNCRGNRLSRIYLCTYWDRGPIRGH